MAFGLEIIEKEDGPAGPADRPALRRALLAQRDAFVANPAAAAAAEALAGHLVALLEQLEPEALGLYWAMRSEFNAAAAVGADRRAALALPFARRSPVGMDYRTWDGNEPASRDECGLPTAEGRVVVPDVVLVPCLGFTAAGYRLGYGGGYFDRWLAAHPGVTAVGVAWSVAEMPEGVFAAEAHDLPLTLVVTEQGVM